MQAPGIATLDHGGTGQLSAVSCAAAGGCSAGGFYTDATTKQTQAFVIGETGGVWGDAEGLPTVANTLNTGGSAVVTAVSCAAVGNCDATGYYRAGTSVHPFAVAESGSVWDGATTVPGSGTDDSEGLAESCAFPQRCSIGGYVPGGSGREVGFVDDQLPSHLWDAALPLPGTLGTAAPADAVATPPGRSRAHSTPRATGRSPASRATRPATAPLSGSTRRGPRRHGRSS
jgi:hypothetical protein